jgi:ABC-type nitrate/sulfonate/bicarbonate transport system permease component
VSPGWGLAGVRRRAAFVVPPLLLVAAAIGGWQAAVIFYHLSPDVLPTPVRVARQGWAERAALWDNTEPTLIETAVGFGVSLALGFLLACVMDFFGVLRRALYPILVASQTLPLMAIAPLMIIWFGFGLFPKVLVVTLVTFFPITVSLGEGFAATDRDATALLCSMGAGRVAQFWKLRLPGAMPLFFAGLRIAITYAVVGAVFAEYVGAEKGLGIYMFQQKNVFRTDLVLAATVLTAAVSVTLFGLTFVLQRITIPWYAAARAQPSRPGSPARASRTRV